MPNDYSVASWKAARRQQREGTKPRPLLTDLEIKLNLLIAKAEACGRLGYMAVNDLATKDGKRPGWAAYYTEAKALRLLKSELAVALGGTPDAIPDEAVVGPKPPNPKSRKK